MRPTQRIFLIPLLLCLLSTLWSEVSWQTGIVNQLGFGTSSYFLDVNDGSEGVQSLLEFPLDALYLGFEAQLAPADRSWQLNGSLLTNVTPPASLMLDYDWFYLVGSPPVPFSYTESNLDYSSLDLRLNGDFRLFKRESLSLYLQGGYRLLYADQLITDFEGWQYRDEDSDSQYELYQVESTQDGIDYLVIYHIVSLGVKLETSLSDGIDLSLAAAPAAGFFFDRDDHLLRNKLSTGRGAGYGFDGEISLTYYFDAVKSSWSPYLSLSGAYSWFFSPGVQRQYWYGDDGSTPEGTEIDNIVHDVTLIDPRIGITIGISGAP